MEPGDELIKSDVVEALSRDSRVNSARITVVVENGRVILSGDAPTLYTAQVASELAACVHSVRSVHSELDVSPPPAGPSDAAIRNYAEQILRWNASVSAGRIGARVEAGILTLEGEVDAYWKRNRAELLMLDIEGIVGVVNRLVVVPELVPQDQVIAADVKSALDRCTCMQQDSITVEVSQGLVTLTGQVPSLWSKHNTPHLVESILGVKGVIDNLVVTQSD